MSERDSYQSFFKISQYAGMREDLVQAGGGNSSLKIADTCMLIKASGYQLAELKYDYGYATVNPLVIKDYFEKTPARQIGKEQEAQLLQKACISGPRPSIETFLHSVTDTLTLHIHSTAVNILTARKGGMDQLKSLFPDALLVEYATPGIELAKAYFKAYQEHNEKTGLIFLKNHGMIISGKSAEDLIFQTEHALKIVEYYLGLEWQAKHEATNIWQACRQAVPDENKILVLSNDASVLKALSENEGQMWSYQFCPDCMVFCGRKVLELPIAYSHLDIQNHYEQWGSPALISHNGAIYMRADTVRKAKEIESVLRFSAIVAAGNKENKMDTLSESEQDFLLNWDAEKYRRNI